MIDRISVTTPTSIRCQRERGSYLPPNWFVADRIAIQTQYLIPLLTLQLGLIVWQRWPVKCKHEYSNYPASFLKTELHSFFFLTFLHLIALCRCNSWSFRSHSESWRQSYSLHIVRCQLYLNKRNNWLLKWERKKKNHSLEKCQSSCWRRLRSSSLQQVVMSSLNSSSPEFIYRKKNTLLSCLRNCNSESDCVQPKIF